MPRTRIHLSNENIIKTSFAVFMGSISVVILKCRASRESCAAMGLFHTASVTQTNHEEKKNLLCALFQNSYFLQVSPQTKGPWREFRLRRQCSRTWPSSSSETLTGILLSKLCLVSSFSMWLTMGATSTKLMMMSSQS